MDGGKLVITANGLHALATMAQNSPVDLKTNRQLRCPRKREKQSFVFVLLCEKFTDVQMFKGFCEDTTPESVIWIGLLCDTSMSK